MPWKLRWHILPGWRVAYRSGLPPSANSDNAPEERPLHASKRCNWPLSRPSGHNWRQNRIPKRCPKEPTPGLCTLLDAGYEFVSNGRAASALTRPRNTLASSLLRPSLLRLETQRSLGPVAIADYLI